MLADTPQTPEQWAEFIAAAETQQTTQQERMREILNGYYSDAEKQAAVHDYMLQSDYLSWVKSKYAEYSQTGVLPADMTYSCNLSGNVYRYFKEGSTTEYDYKLLELGIPPYADTNEHEIAHMQPAEVRTFDLIKSPDLTLQLKVTAGSWADPIIKYKYYTGNYPGFSIFTDNYQRTTFEILASGRWATDASYAPSSSTDSNRNYYKIGYAWSSGFTWIPTWGQWRSAFWGPKSYGPSGSDNTDGIVAQQVTTVQKSGIVDTPWDFYNDSILPDVDPDDAFFPGGYSPIPQKPDPDMPEFPEEVENSGDDIELPEPSDVGAGSSGFITFYAMTNAQVQTLGQLLYTTFTDPDYYKNFLPFTMGSAGSVNISDIISLFISFRQYPFPLLNLSSYTGVGQTFFIGSGAVGLPFGTTLHSINCLDYVDCGTCSIPFWFGDFRDYQTQITLYLPYCGTVDLNPADVMGGTLQCTYAIDFCTGACTAYVTVTSWDGKKYPVAQLPGQIGADVPLSGTNAGQISARIGGDVLNFAGTVLSGAKNVVSGGIGAVVGGISGNLGSTAKQGYGALFSEWDTLVNIGKQIAGIGQRGSVAAPALSAGRGFAAFKNAATAYIQVRSPIYSMPDNYAAAVGYPSTDAVQIDSCTGFCQFVNVDVSGITADARDAASIKRLLEQGIYVNAAPTT